MAILLSAILALLPLTLAPSLLFYYDITPKIVVLLTGTAIGLILARREAQARSPELRVFGMLLIAQAASLAVSTAFSSDAALSLGGSMWRRFGLISQVAMLLFAWFAAQYAAGDAGRVRHLIRAIAVAGIPAAVYGIFQYFGWDPFIDKSLYHIGEAPPTGNPGLCQLLRDISAIGDFRGSRLDAGGGIPLVEARGSGGGRSGHSGGYADGYARGYAGARGGLAVPGRMA
jgi:hypothetical protein